MLTIWFRLIWLNKVLGAPRRTTIGKVEALRLGTPVNLHVRQRHPRQIAANMQMRPCPPSRPPHAVIDDHI
ncbi:hypothetical protein F4774DRAFT_396433 [Daldinia eschscholtzii]|nr:hypothetical protein F4774DRAFT_396433 [Daldinia eschscholtzii]